MSASSSLSNEDVVKLELQATKDATAAAAAAPSNSQKRSQGSTPSPATSAKKAKKTASARKAITTVPNFGGRRCGADGPASVQSWAPWDCDPEDRSGRTPTQKHGYGRSFPWNFDMLEKAYVLTGSATLTADDPALHGAAITIGPKVRGEAGRHARAPPRIQLD